MPGDSIAVLPYDPAWPDRFESERVLLKRVLAPWLEGGVHHIGSTAIPGIAAKPIVDMMVGVRNLEEARAAFGPLRTHAYLPSPHRPQEAHHFSKPSLRLSEVTHALHLTEPGGSLWRERLAFRDTLRADPTLVGEYSTLKHRLAREHGADIAAYTEGKRTFVAGVLAEAGVQLGRSYRASDPADTSNTGSGRAP